MKNRITSGYPEKPRSCGQTGRSKGENDGIYYFQFVISVQPLLMQHNRYGLR